MWCQTPESVIEAITLADTKKTKRCPWSLSVSDAYQAYHDTEWGVPARDDQTQFEFLLLEGAQAGLSWSTVLHKREGYRKAFADFDPVKVGRFTDKRIEKLILNPAIIRNRLKINSAVKNARAFLEVQAEFDSFSDYIWGFVDGEPVQNRWRSQKQVPATSAISDVLSKDLKKRGFKFVGSTIIYAHMQATGMVNDHITGCYRYETCRKLA
jgi:DNA-3-methyladenine glycosylase I